MSQRVKKLVGVLKDKGAILTLTAGSPDLAVLRATTHSPYFNPNTLIPPLLSFGTSSRLSATSLLTSLTTRLSSCKNNAIISLKCLLSLHHILSRGSFILVDTIYSSFKPISGRRSPINFSSFKSSSSLALSAWVRHYARLLEMFLVSKPLSNNPDVISGMLNNELVRETEVLVSILEEIVLRRPIEVSETNEVVKEVVRMVEEERSEVVSRIRVRVSEIKERFGEFGFADAVELVCLVRRMEVVFGDGECCCLVMMEMRELREGFGVVVEERGGRVRREKTSESARINYNIGYWSSGEVVEERGRAGSSRWVS